MSISASCHRRRRRRDPGRAHCSSDARVMNDLGKSLVVIGLLIAMIGVVLLLAGRVPWLGRLPGDIHVQRGNWSFYFPVVTSLVVSVLLTLVFWLFGRR